MSHKVTYCLFTTNVRRLAKYQLFAQLAYAISRDGKRSFSCAISAETSQARTTLSRTKPALSDDIRLRELRRGQLCRPFENYVGSRNFSSGDLTGSHSRAFQPDDSGCRGPCLQLTGQTLHLRVYNSEGSRIKRCKQTGVLFRRLRGEGAAGQVPVPLEKGEPNDGETVWRKALATVTCRTCVAEASEWCEIRGLEDRRVPPRPLVFASGLDVCPIWILECRSSRTSGSRDGVRAEKAAQGTSEKCGGCFFMSGAQTAVRYA
ncbi:hypothetical protein CKAH01_12230 [Colletotrichum kahawae]|uniref:Uncharacterized protein n=1 Tax=Colletotrichum kahawae TaxID=34407 RepID=A0AAD9YSX9_COLKA|nr:hypothetical protein CKAH01_12230 [Colletotrichum kahawae]